MGNRAVITTAPFDPNNLGIYLHWNGGRASVEGFLGACKELGYSDPARDHEYGMARLCGAIHTFFADDGLSLGIDVCRRLDCDNGDNGVYLLGEGFAIAGRMYPPDHEECNDEKAREICAEIVSRVKSLRRKDEPKPTNRAPHLRAV